MININKYSMGATAAIITSLALIAGLAHDDSTKTSIIAGLLIIAVADNIADSLSIHICKEAEGACKKDVYSSTLGNFTVRLILALTFVAIVFLLPSYLAVIISVLWGLLLLTILSFYIAKARKANPFKEIVWHLLIASLVIVGSKLLGTLISNKIIR
jgi:vacuolar iron transporter family protein